MYEEIQKTPFFFLNIGRHKAVNILISDINECEEHTPCLNGTCQNTVGGWFCACDKYSNFTRLNSSHGQCDGKFIL